MKKTFKLLALVAVSIIILASCAQQDRGLSSLVPADALGFVQITDPEKFIADADAFIQPLGVSAMTGNLGVKDMLSLALKSGAKLDLTAIDLKKPLGFALLAPSGDSKDFGVILYVPLIKPEESSPKLEEMFKKVPGMNATITQGYGIYYNGPKQSFPPAKSIAVPDSLSFEPGTITVYGDVTSILSHYKTEYETAKKDALTELENSQQALQSASPLNADLGGVTGSMVTQFFQAVEQTRSVAFHLKLDGTGLSGASTVEFAGDGGIAKLIQNVGPGKNISALTKYIPASFLTSAALSGDPLAFKDINKAIMDMYFQALKIDDATKTAFAALLDDSFKIAGKNSAVSFDLGLDEKITQTPDQDIAANLASLFTVRLIAVSDVTNGTDYQKLLNDSIRNGALANYINKLLEPSGFTFKMTLDDAKDGDFAWQEIKFDLQLTNANKLDLDNEASRNMATMAAGLLQKFTVAVAVKNNKVYMVMGENAPDTLKKVANADQVDNSVEKNEHWTTWLKTVPQDAQYIGNLSIARILDIAKIASKNAVAVEIPEADKSGIFTWIHATNSRVDSAMFWSLKELTPLVKEGVKDFGSIMNIFSGDTQSAAPTTGAGIGSESDTTMPDGSPGSTQTGTSDSTTTTLQ